MGLARVSLKATWKDGQPRWPDVFREGIRLLNAKLSDWINFIRQLTVKVQLEWQLD